MAVEGRIPGFRALVEAKKLKSLARRLGRKLTGKRMDRYPAALPRAIPKIVWIYWHTGEETAPPIVKGCIESWRRLNPGWEIRVIDGQNMEATVDMPFPLGGGGKNSGGGGNGAGGITVQAYSDLLRLRLLRRFGGVWTDATVACLKPLDDWLPVLAQRGFFAWLWTEADSWFIWPNERRIVTSWFLASEPEGAIVTPWERKSFAYWQGRKTPDTYYWVHVIFEWLKLNDRSFRAALAEMPQLGAYGPHIVHDHVLKGRDPAEVRAALDSGAVPVQKLRWNWQEQGLARAREAMAGRPGFERI